MTRWVMSDEMGGLTDGQHGQTVTDGIRQTEDRQTDRETDRQMRWMGWIEDERMTDESVDGDGEREREYRMTG